jgi:hypothetical protein
MPTSPKKPVRFPVLPTLILVGLGLTVGGCNSGPISEGLRPVPTASVGSPSRQTQPPDAIGNETALASEPVDAPRAQAALQSNTNTLAPQTPPVSFLPVTGAPHSTVAALATSMRRAALAQSVPIVVSINDGAQYQIKGYFSALSDSGTTILVYVWDVLDRNGTRIHRISGQERTRSASGSDPWMSVDENLIDHVAQSTMSSLRTWMRTQSG